MTEILLTTGEIARRLDERTHRVEYIIKSRGIRPAGRAGHLRVFTAQDLSRIAANLRRPDASRDLGVPK